MSLRVLLADESTNIKRALELALVEYEVEVKLVNVGLDVVPLAKKFRPDIIFVDVLLQKRDGYLVCQDIKKEPELNGIPVVLTWSDYMELEDSKVSLATPDEKLSKPFRSYDVKKIIETFFGENPGELVPPNLPSNLPPNQLSSQPPTQINMDGTPEKNILHEDHEPSDPYKKENNTNSATNATSEWEMKPLKQEDEFVKKDLTQDNNPDVKEEITLIRQDVLENTNLDNFEIKLDENTTSLEDDLSAMDADDNSAPMAPPQQQGSGTFSEIQTYQLQMMIDQKIEEAFSKSMGENISNHTQNLIEQKVKEIIPEIAETLIKEEIKRLLGETE